MESRCIDCGRPYPVDDALWHPDPNGRCYDRTKRRPATFRKRLLSGVGSAVTFPLIIVGIVLWLLALVFLSRVAAIVIPVLIVLALVVGNDDD